MKKPSDPALLFSSKEMQNLGNTVMGPMISNLNQVRLRRYAITTTKAEQSLAAIERPEKIKMIFLEWQACYGLLLFISFFVANITTLRYLLHVFSNISSYLL